MSAASLLEPSIVPRRAAASTSFVLGSAAKRLRLRALQVDPPPLRSRIAG
jgi:hypothetical protein